MDALLDHPDSGMSQWDTSNLGTCGKGEIFVQDINPLRKMYKLKHMYED